jgi:hypothetical protein
VASLAQRLVFAMIPAGLASLAWKIDFMFCAPARVWCAEAPATQSNHVKRKLKQRSVGHKLDSLLDDQMAVGRLYACISSRPGQVRGRGRWGLRVRMLQGCGGGGVWGQQGWQYVANG